MKDNGMARLMTMRTNNKENGKQKVTVRLD